MFNRLVKCLDKYNMLSLNRFGFRPNHATYIPLLSLTGEITANVEDSKYSIGIF